jgi:hypothetical protein
MPLQRGKKARFGVWQGSLTPLRFRFLSAVAPEHLLVQYKKAGFRGDTEVVTNSGPAVLMLFEG